MTKEDVLISLVLRVEVNNLLLGIFIAIFPGKGITV